MNYLTVTTSLILSLSMASWVGASPRWDEHPKHKASFEDSARVIKVKPIYEMVSVSIPEERCWNEKVRRHSSHHNDSLTSPLLGAIVGGVVGNQFGRKSGKTALTVAGSLLGASIGSDLAKDNHYRHDRGHNTLRRCETINNYETREEIVGYRVKYRYKGRVYRTRMDRHPGDSLRIQVSVSPLQY